MSGKNDKHVIGTRVQIILMWLIVVLLQIWLISEQVSYGRSTEGHKYEPMGNSSVVGLVFIALPLVAVLLTALYWPKKSK